MLPRPGPKFSEPPVTTRAATAKSCCRLSAAQTFCNAIVMSALTPESGHVQCK
jgi:hypothetical protein